MGIKDVVKVSRKTFFNPRAWIGYDAIKEQSRTVWTLTKDAVNSAPRQPQRIESFEEAMARLGVDEKDVKSTGRTYLGYAIFFLVLAVLDFIYGGYLLFHHHVFLGFILALAVCALMLSQAFKYHFWYFQIKNRKLGCTFEEWWRGRIEIEEKPLKDLSP